MNTPSAIVIHQYDNNSNYTNIESIVLTLKDYQTHPANTQEPYTHQEFLRVKHEAATILATEIIENKMKYDSMYDAQSNSYRHRFRFSNYELPKDSSKPSYAELEKQLQEVTKERDSVLEDLNIMIEDLHKEPKEL